MKRLDKFMVEQGLAGSRTQAQKLILAGAVSAQLAGERYLLDKPSVKIGEDTELFIAAIDELKYVSRAGLKLEAAFSQLQSKGLIESTQGFLKGAVVLDIGQSTGGFTDFVLQHGAAKVVGVDVGHGQLHPGLCEDQRVLCLEGVNARNLPVAELLSHSAGGFDLLVMDVSFISQTLVVPHLAACLRRGACILSLVKPQFEVGKANIAKGGIVRDQAALKKTELTVKEAFARENMPPIVYFPCPVKGADGNQEFILWAQKG